MKVREMVDLLKEVDQDSDVLLEYDGDLVCVNAGIAPVDFLETPSSKYYIHKVDNIYNEDAVIQKETKRLIIQGDPNIKPGDKNGTLDTYWWEKY